MFENHEFEIFLHASSLRKSQKAFSETVLNFSVYETCEF